MKTKKERKLQIGLIGSYSDLKFSKEAERVAFVVGRLVAKSGCVLLVGGEKDGGLTKAAARGSVAEGGLVVGFMPEKKNACDYLDVIVQTGGFIGLREYLLVISCDALIAIGGGSGTLNEITVAYQNNIPVVMLDRYGGWAQKLAGMYLDKRKRYKFIAADSPKQAVEKAINLAKKRREESSS